MLRTNKMFLSLALLSTSFVFSSDFGPGYCPGNNLNLKYSEACLDQALIRAEALRVRLEEERKKAEEIKALAAARDLEARKESPIFYHQDQKPSKYDTAAAAEYTNDTEPVDEKACRIASFAHKNSADARRKDKSKAIKNMKPGNRRS